MAEYTSICRQCFHSYVCEQFNEHRECDNKKCHFANDHFVPPADVVEVKHGYFRETTEPLGWQDVSCIECSVCKESWILDEDFDFDFCKEFWKYCPNCGAKMDKVSEGDNND